MPELSRESLTSKAPDFWRDPHTSAVGDLRFHDFKSRVFRNTRLLRVWVPPGYAEPGNTHRYPVFYLNDAQNLFDPATAFAGVDWQVDETVDRLVREQKVPPMLVVGIDNTGVQRIKEFIPYITLHPRVLRPRGKKYPQFLVREVMPFIAKNYRVASGPENTGLGGSSLGGLISLYTAMAAPGVFGKLLVESPSLFIAGHQVVQESRRHFDWPRKIFLGIGNRETGRDERNQRLVEDVRDLERVLRHAGLGEDRLRVRIGEGATHSEGAWADRFPEAVEFLFG
jgi:enterochelin esterase-like enzyme